MFSSPKSLEVVFFNEVFSLVDVNREVNFTFYDSPNEGGVKAIKEHLDQIDTKGLLVESGGDNLVFSPDSCCSTLEAPVFSV